MDPVRLSSLGGTFWGRTLADDLRENPKPVDTTPHPHFHSHGGIVHLHQHVHPEDHAHSARRDLPAHGGSGD